MAKAETKLWIPGDSGYCELRHDDNFVTIETDRYEGQAFMSWDIAEKLHKALGEALAQHQSPAPDPDR